MHCEMLRCKEVILLEQMQSHCNGQGFPEFPVHGTALNSQPTHRVGIWQEMRLESRKGRICVGHEEKFRFYLKCVESLLMYL